MPRYRNDGSMPLNYGDRGPWVEPGQEFDTADYPEIPADQVASHLQSGFISEVVTPIVAVADRQLGIIDELHVHADRRLIDALERSGTT